jgi:hypothetical protein
LLLGQEGVLRWVFETLFRVALEALEERDLRHGVGSSLQDSRDIGGYWFAVRRQEQARDQAGQLAQRLGGRFLAGVGPVVPVGGVRRPQLARRRQSVPAEDR